MRTRCHVSIAAAALLGCMAHAQVRLPAVFSDHMVLQRDAAAPFWGWADAGEHIVVSGSWGAQAHATADAGGRWRTDLPTPPAGGPFTVTVTGSNTVTFDDVLSGEVWLCSGQSNMQWRVRNAADAEREIAAAELPRIRLLSIPNVTANAPQEDFPGAGWVRCSPTTVPDFSATAFYFGRKLYRELDVPIGLIASSWGGTGIEAWTPWDSQQGDPAVQALRASWDARDAAFDPAVAKARYERQRKAWDAWNAGGKQGKAPPRPRLQERPGTNQNYPSNLYNAMIQPLVPFAMRGAIWYQGEHNSGEGERYRVLLQRLIEAWRQRWGHEFPFYFVQLPSYREPWQLPVEGGWALIRESFLSTAKEVPHTGMAITIDIGEEKDIHPKNKQDVGDRLGRLALHETYGRTGFAWCGPVPESCEFRDGKAILSFATGGAPLAVRGGGKLYGFALTGAEGIAVHADAVIRGPNRVEVSSAEIPEPTMVHYAWADNPVGVNLVNADGLPASPFRWGSVPPLDVFARLLPEEAARYRIVYGFDPLDGKLAGDTRFVYPVDRSVEVEPGFTKVAYFLALQAPDGAISYAFVAMDPFTTDVARIGVPTKASGARFQQRVTGAVVKSNVPGIATGEFPEGCSIEFWDCNYGGGNAAGIPGATDLYDFGDAMSPETSPGYGCMQIHNWRAQQSILCFNKFDAGRNVDLGIGNSAGRTRDWTFTASGKDVARAQFLVLVLP